MRKTYLRWGMGVCVALLVFAVGILLVGYKPLTVGNGATMALLAAGAIACGVMLRRER